MCVCVFWYICTCGNINLLNMRMYIYIYTHTHNIHVLHHTFRLSCGPIYALPPPVNGTSASTAQYHTPIVAGKPATSYEAKYRCVCVCVCMYVFVYIQHSNCGGKTCHEPAMKTNDYTIKTPTYIHTYIHTHTHTHTCEIQSCASQTSPQ